MYVFVNANYLKTFRQTTKLNIQYSNLYINILNKTYNYLHTYGT